MFAADIVLVQGSIWLSQEICKITKSEVSHAAMIIGGDPAICLEALNRVVTNPLQKTVANAKHVWLMRDPTLTPQQRQEIVYAALGDSANGYAYLDLLLQGMDAAFQTNAFTHNALNDALLRHWQYCSQLVAQGYWKGIGREFGKPVDSLTPGDLFEAGQKSPYKLFQLA